jgi:hypothetical protein
MKTILLSVGSALLASALTIMLSRAFGAHGETFRIIAVLTVTVSCTTALAAACLGRRSGKSGKPA